MESRSRLSANHPRVEARNSSPPSSTRPMARAISTGDATVATVPLTPSSTSSVAALSGLRQTITGVPAAAASTTTMP